MNGQVGSIPTVPLLYGRVTQLGECLPCKQEVASSSLVTVHHIWRVSGILVNTSGFQSEDCGFDPRTRHQKFFCYETKSKWISKSPTAIIPPKRHRLVIRGRRMYRYEFGRPSASAESTGSSPVALFFIMGNGTAWSGRLPCKQDNRRVRCPYSPPRSIVQVVTIYWVNTEIVREYSHTYGERCGEVVTTLEMKVRKSNQNDEVSQW